MPATSVAYRALIRLGAAAAPLGGLVLPKVRAGLAGRAGAVDRIAAWAGSGGGPVVWVHAPSVGEGLQAEAVLAILRRERPDWRLLYTWFSPSAERLATRLPVDHADYLPWDRPADIDRVLAAVRPAALVFVKLDVWPELATRAAARGTPVLLVAGTVSPLSSRLRWPARALQAPGYASLHAAGAIADDDARRLVSLGARADRITVTGDPRFDSVAGLVDGVPAGAAARRLGPGGPALIAGSTWPADETVLLDAFGVVRRTHPDARLVLVPHEPSPGHLRGIDRYARGIGLPVPRRISAGPAPGAPLIVVDQLGLLATLYGAGIGAYVGGGFGRAGLHSVLEPAAWGLPVIFGPRWQGSRDAGLLREAGGGMALPRTGASTALAAAWLRWLEDEAGRAEGGRAARGVVQAGLGAAADNAALVLRAVERPESPLPASPSGARSSRG